MEQTKCLIIGSGPAGYTAAIYAGRANLSPIEYCGLQPGGQLTQTTEVENFPGYPQGVDANQMMMEIREQAERFGAETGSSAKYLGLDDERKYNGQGVSACATCDGFFYRKKTVAVVGGGDTACEDALYLAGLAKKVYLIVRKPYLRASQVMQQRVMERENIEILFEHNTLGLFGENGVEGAHLVKRKGEPDEELVDIQIDGFFLAIGHTPNTAIFKEWLDTDEVGYLKNINGTPATKIPGVFVAGDCADPVFRQAIVAAGSGCQAAILAERYLLGR